MERLIKFRCIPITILKNYHSIEHYPNAWGLIFGDKIFLSKTTFDLTQYKGFIFCSERCDRSNPIEQMIGQDNLYIFDDRRDEPILNAKMGLFHPTSSGLLAISVSAYSKAFVYSPMLR